MTNVPGMDANASESFAALFETTARVLPKGRQENPGRGQRLTGKVISRTEDGFYVDLGAKCEGLLALQLVVDADGNTSVEVGQTIDVQVTGNDSSGMPMLRPAGSSVTTMGVEIRGSGGGEGWRASRGGRASDAPSVSVTIGSHVSGKVTGVERYGVFLQLDGTDGRGGRGLIPTAETATPRGADLRRAFALGSTVKAKVVHIDEQGRIRLSVGALARDAEDANYKDFHGEGAASGAEQSGEAGEGAGAHGTGAHGAVAKARQGSAGKSAAGPRPVRGFGTLGDLLNQKLSR